ncbi:DUF3180 family protein [Motilibacter rhizosphaerae]|nr:DUF3180 family protein [Motilibacter rhizosphaerae]
MRIAVLATVAVVAGVAAWALLVLLDARSVDVLTASWLAVPPTLPVGLLVVAVGLAVAVRAWRQRVSGHPDARPLEPLSAARAVAAAKASGAVGAVVGGAYLGYAAYLVPDAHSELRTSRLVGCAAVVVCSVLVVAAAVALERVLRLPDDDEDDPSGADRR